MELLDEKCFLGSTDDADLNATHLEAVETFQYKPEANLEGARQAGATMPQSLAKNVDCVQQSVDPPVQDPLQQEIDRQIETEMHDANDRARSEAFRAKFDFVESVPPELSLEEHRLATITLESFTRGLQMGGLKKGRTLKFRDLIPIESEGAETHVRSHLARRKRRERGKTRTSRNRSNSTQYAGM